MNASQHSRANTFAALELDRAAERRADADWLHALEHASGTRYLLLDADGQLLVEPGHDAPQLLDAATRWRIAPELPASLLGVRGERAWFVLRLSGGQSASVALPPAVRRMGLRAAGSSFDAFNAGLAAYACGLVQWQAATRYCSACGAPLALTHAGHRAVCSAPGCGREHYPRTDPAVIMLVEHDGACLLGRQSGWPDGRYSTLAGFVEPGEALEDAVRREVAEETGVRVAGCDYHSSQPWPFPASLMLGFTAWAETREVSLRDGELADARWFTPREIVRAVRGGELTLSSPLSISHRLIADWLRRREGIELGSLRVAGARDS